MSQLFTSLFAGLFAFATLVAQTPPAKVPIERDIDFGVGGDVKLKLDLCRPANGTKPYPVVVCIHGGAWETGNRSDFHDTIKTLAREGYFAASVQYRFAPKHP